MGIKNAKTLFDLLKKRTSSDLQYSMFPTVISSVNDMDSNGRQGVSAIIANYILKQGRPCTYEEIDQEFIKNRRYNENTVRYGMRRSDLLRYADGCLTHIDCLDLKDGQRLKTLCSCAMTVLERAAGIGQPYGTIDDLMESSCLPSISSSFSTTQTLVASLLAHSGKFRILGAKRNAFVLVDNQHDIRYISDLIRLILKDKYEGATSVSELSKFLHDNGVINSRVTHSMLTSAQDIVIQNEEIYISGNQYAERY